MALVAGQIQKAQVAATDIDILSAYVQQRLTERAILIPSIIDRSSEAVKGVGNIKIGRRTALTSETKAEGTEYTAQRFTWSTDDLNPTANQEGVYTQLTSLADLNSLLNQESEILQASADALIAKLEASVYTALSATSASTPDHRVALATQDTLSTQDILEARRLLLKQYVPVDNDLFLAINPDQETDLLAMDKFTDASKYGSNMPLIMGEIGRIYGFRVLVSNSVTSSTAVAYHRTHVAFARMQTVQWSQDRILKDSVSEYLLESFYGLKTLDAGIRGVLLNNTGA